MYLDNEIKCHLTSFDDFMSLKGELFRYQKGRHTQRVKIGNEIYFIKQHTGVGWKEIFKNILQFRLPVLSAKAEKLAIQKLESLGILVPAIAAYGKRGINPARLQSFILTKALAPVISLEELSKNWKLLPPSYAFKQQLIHEVARITRVLHENGVNHRDLYICHFLLRQINPLKLYLIDLHRAQIHAAIAERWRIKDLAALYFSTKEINLTRRDLIRFIELYTGFTFRKIWQDNPHFWQKVMKRGEEIYRAHPK